MEVVMSLAYRILLAVHILSAIAAVAVFWVGAVTRKGSPRHVAVGRLFVVTMATVAITALAMSALNVAVPAAVHSLAEFQGRGATMGGDRSRATVADLAREFRLNAVWLSYVSVQLLVALRFGVQVVRTRRLGARALGVDTALAVLVFAGGVVLALAGARIAHPLIAAFGVMGALASGRRLVVLLRPSRSPMAWWYEHMGTLLGAGIPLHVTMLLAVGRHLPGPPGSWRFALPSVVLLGLPAITMWIRYYRRRFEPRAPRAHAAKNARPTTQPA
jgi:uncharacterized membrane protein